MGDIPAPVLRTATVRPAPMPLSGPVDPGHGRVLLEDDFSDLVADTRMGASPARATRTSILGAVLLGGMIACAIVALAFVLRP
ncbi:hypothetical protein [uncultured Amaricoccus sp.]|uniref:hypothetical protein n=1 Tax=uncultured Amaricoccus sp. TaxID=339341 RepID=UPI00261680C0|nr:hypothetical protein [uncultured Amaricoccus sp.]